MDGRQAEQLFHEADVLFRRGDYTQALKRLDFLAEQYPNEPKILFPRALALTELQRFPEALEICERLIHQHQHEKALELKDQIRSFQLAQQKPPASKSFDTPPDIPAVGAPNFPQTNVDEILNQPPAYARTAAAAPPARTSAGGGLPWPLLLLFAAALLVLLFVFFGAALLGLVGLGSAATV